MIKTLLLSEITDEKISQNTYELINIANEISDEVSLVILNFSDCKTLSKDFDKLYVDFIYVLTVPPLNTDKGIYNIDTFVISKFIESKNYDLILLSKTEYGSIVGPRVAFRNKKEYLSDCVAINLRENGFSITRPIYGGVANADYKIPPGISPIISFRPGLSLSSSDIKHPIIEEITFEYSCQQHVKMINEFNSMDENKIKLEDAKIIVSGGRGIGGELEFKELNKLVNLLGGALGASRAACDAGWVDHSYQIGLTGKTVSPDLYISVGISGARQHLAGCSMSRNIVAINNDKNANIFNVARFGVVGDWKSIVKSLISKIEDLNIR